MGLHVGEGGRGRNKTKLRKGSETMATGFVISYMSDTVQGRFSVSP